MARSQQQQAGILIARIEADAQAEIGAILAKGKARAEAEIAAAHAAARAKIRRSISDLRNGEDRALLRTEAELDTRERQLRQEHDAKLLETAMDHLRAQLPQLWEEAETRQAWALNVVETAAQTLPAGTWRIEHPSGWRGPSREAAIAAATDRSGHAPMLQPDKTLAAGLRIWSGDACVDGSDTALLTREGKLRALLLAELADLESGGAA